jgi:hypothetical protein
MLRSAESPAPGDYNPRYPDASKISQRFSTANPKSNLECLIHEAKGLPGPGQYGESLIVEIVLVFIFFMLSMPTN